MTRADHTDEACIYDIKVSGQLAASTTGWLGDLQVVNLPSGDCLLRSRRMDQAALYGLVARMRDLGLGLISINRVPESEQREAGQE